MKGTVAQIRTSNCKHSFTCSRGKGSSSWLVNGLFGVMRLCNILNWTQVMSKDVTLPRFLFTS